MRTLAFWVALALLTPAGFAFAQGPKSDLVEATPLGSPGDWVPPENYPRLAVRLLMTGRTTFKLTVNTSGMPSRCEIVESSGFDVLDNGTCELLMANAKFVPPRDHAGNPVEATFQSRVNWNIPTDDDSRIREDFISSTINIGEAGNFLSCETAILSTTEKAEPTNKKPCPFDLTTMPPKAAMALRAGYTGPSAQIKYQQAIAFSPELRARVLAPMPGYEQRVLNVYAIGISKDGTIKQCSYVEQRGNPGFATNYCERAGLDRYSPPTSSFGPDGLAHGWRILRALIKTEQ